MSTPTCTGTTRETLRAAIAATSGLLVALAVVLMPVVTSAPAALAMGGANHCEPDLDR